MVGVHLLLRSTYNLIRKVNLKVYISGLLTTTGDLATQLTNFYESIAVVCSNMGLVPYLPHRHTPPQDTKISPEDVYNIDVRSVLDSQLFIAEISNASIGVGMELMLAIQAGIPIIVLYQKDARVSKMALGIKKKTVIVYTDKNEALVLLFSVLADKIRLL